MDKETLSNYGWIVICVMVLAVMIALATPFGSFVSEAVQSTTKGLFDVNQNALDAAGIQIMEQEFEEMLNGGDAESGGGTGAETPSEPEETPTDPEPTECQHTNTTVINASSTYTGDTHCNDCNTTIATGETIVNLNPDDGTTPTNGDTYECGAYIYTYKTSSNGWKVAINTTVTDKNQTSYGPILESINGEPITSLSSTFYNCTSLTTVPAIPSSVTDMQGTFANCTSLADLSSLVIPNGVTNMQSTFSKCTSLTNLSSLVIPNGVTNMQSTFNGCTSLTKAPTIPYGVTDMTYTFASCYALTTAPAIPSSVTYMISTFAYCSNLTNAPAIPNSVTKMGSAFRNCTSLKIAPDMSNATSVADMNVAFRECTALTNGPDLSNCTKLTNMGNAFYGCTALTSKLAIPSSVTTAESSIYEGCTQFGY